MKFFSRFLALPVAGLLALGSARAETPYLETASLSVLWNFTITGITGTTIGLTPLIDGAFDPEKMRPEERITNESGRLITYPVRNGNQQFFVDKLILNLINDAKDQAATLKEEMESLEDGPEKDALADLIEALENRAKYFETEKNGRWELTAVRESQSTLAGALSTPFKVFLTRIEPPRGRPSATFLTDFVMTPLGTVANVTETLYDGTPTETLSPGRVTKAAGTATIHLRFEFECFDTAAKEHWLAFGTGFLNCNIRSTPGPLAAVTITKPSITGHGSWRHQTETGGGNGIAPLSIKMGEIKYQNRNLFPEFITSSFE